MKRRWLLQRRAKRLNPSNARHPSLRSRASSGRFAIEAGSIVLLSAIAILIPALLALPAPTFARSADVLHFKGHGVSAVFSSTSADPSGCVATNVFVFGGGGLSHNPPDPRTNRATGIAVNIFLFDSCTNTIVLDAIGGKDMSATEFTIGKSLASATLDATIPVEDRLSGQSFNLDVQLVWSASGPPTRNKEHNHVHLPGVCVANDFFRSTIRDAAVSGTVSDGTTNFTPEPALGGLLISTRSARVTIGDCEEE